jgi:uncharacterized damage-inducible protein DinB
MNALDLIEYNTRRQLDRFFDAVKLIPAEKLSWQPNPESRSVLDQVQEVATVFKGIPKAVTNRKLEFTPEQYAESVQKRKAITELAELERTTREATEEFLAFLKSVPEESLSETVEMPWPGQFNVADLLGYHSWNMAYHEGQVYYIAGLLGGRGGGF